MLNVPEAFRVNACIEDALVTPLETKATVTLDDCPEMTLAVTDTLNL
jgi:hypothetical protein